VCRRHEPVAVLLAPDAARHAAVHVPDALGVEQFGVARVVGVAGVAALDNQVALGQDVGQPADRAAGDLAGRDHHPDHPGRGEHIGEIGQRGHVTDLGTRVVADHLVARGTQPVAHVAAHAAEPDESELHFRAP